MKLYADRPLSATNKLLGDLLVVAWAVLWVWLATVVHGKVAALAGPGRDAEDAGRGLATSLGRAASRVDAVPLAGDRLRAPFDDAAGAGRDLAAAARSYQETVADLATFTALAVAVVPLLVVLALWLPRRVRWVVAASAAARLLAASAGDGGADDDRAADLFALRALVRQPPSRLLRVSSDPAQAWRDRDAQVLVGLAELELRELGLHARPPRR
jgi:hypothetical protein